MEEPEINPLFNFLYAATAGGESYTDAFDRIDLAPGGAWLEDAVETLRRFPLDRIQWGYRNSRRTDVLPLPAFGGVPGAPRGYRVNGKVLPVDERYVGHWNHDPWRLDQGGRRAHPGRWRRLPAALLPGAVRAIHPRMSKAPGASSSYSINMSHPLSRRRFLAAMPTLPLLGQSLRGESRPAKITAVEIWQVRGHRETVRGADQQYQANPLYIYDELRPAPYRDSANPTSAKVATSALYLKIKTDASAEGFYGPVDKEAAIVVDEQLRPFLMGKDALAQEKLWDQLYRSNRHARRGHFLMAISAVDNTLWDLRGRYFKTPVYRLLGGPTRASVEAYASCLGYSLEPGKVQSRAAQLKKEGFRHQKWFLAYGPGDGYEGLRKNVDLVRILREAVGEDTELMFDVYSGWDLTYALEWAKHAERYRPRWIEEATQAEKIDSFAQLRKGTSIPVASGEHIQGRWEVYDYLKEGALSVVQCDPEWCGGTTELQKICVLASIFDVPVIPHGHSLHAALHVIAAQSPAVCPLAEYLILKMQSYYHFEKSPPVLRNAHFALPDAPGYGIELDDAKVESREMAHWS